MSQHLSVNFEKIKHTLYLISILILFALSILVLGHAVMNFTSMDFLQSIMSRRSLALLTLCGAVLLSCFFLLINHFLSALSERSQIQLTLLLALGCMILQYVLLFSLQAVLRYDHLRVFDGALEILRTGKLSLTANESYFGHYPFNVPITIFHSVILRIIMFLGIPETGYMLALQDVYLFLIDLGIFFSWHIVRILHSVKNATLFAILCFFNPILYVCAAGCYTTTLMVPLLMGTMLILICFLKEKHSVKKLVLGFLFGTALAFGSKLRATVLIVGIALGIYLLIRVKNPDMITISKKQFWTLSLSVLVGGLLSYGSWVATENLYVTEDSTNSQMPPIYYLMFAANPETKGTYNKEDFQMISAYNTLEEKKAVSFQVLKERIGGLGIIGTLSLADHKLSLTWSDGTEDYADFLVTSRNYSTLHSFIAGNHRDFFALYCHIYHVCMMGMFLIAVYYALKRKCDTSYYLIFLTLLGGMLFHIFWESYYVYSLGFSMLIYIPASEGISHLSEKKLSKNPYSLGIFSLSAFVLLLCTVYPYAKELRLTEVKQQEFAVVQDMTIGERLPLLSGDVITQTFQTDHAFNRVGCKVFNKTGTQNTSQYRLELLSEDNTVLGCRDFYGLEVPDMDYCYLEVGPVIPEGNTTYTIRITALNTTEEHYLTFAYYNTHNYDIYADGFMTGLDSDEKSDLTFTVFNSVVKSFFH